MRFTGERFIPGTSGSIALEHIHRYRFCVDFITGKDVLDIACGEGYGTAIMAPHARKVWGVDISDEAIQHAKQTHVIENVEFRQGSCTAIPLPDACVDVVVSFETIEHLAEHDEMVIELRRVLRPGGVLIISSPDKLAYSDKRGFKNPFHVRELYAAEFEGLLKANFAHVVTFAQRVTYGSSIMCQTGDGKLGSYGIDDDERVAGLADPLYQIAVASDATEYLQSGRSGIMEETVFRSEAVMEKVDLIELQRADLATAAVKIEQAERRAAAAQLPPPDILAELQHLSASVRALGQEVASLALSAQKRSFLNRISFHPNGKPRGWLRAVLLSDETLGTPRTLTRRLLFKKSGKVRAQYRTWYRRYEVSPENAVLFEYTQFLRAQLSDGRNAIAKTLCVVTTPHTIYIAEAIKSALSATRLTVSSVTEMPKNFAHDLYIVVAPQMFQVLPPRERTIVYQVEQVRASPWVDTDYLERIRTCLAVLDYSTDNINALIERGLLLKQLFYVPIQPIVRADKKKTRDVDVLFYGATGGSARRDAYLKALSKQVNVRIENKLFGDEIAALLDRTKVVVNIHYYDNAVLETTRLSEALSHGAHVVSEEAVNQADHDDLAAHVDFVPCGEIEAFVEQVRRSFASWTAPKRLPPREDVGSSGFLLLRALHGLGVLSFQEFCAATARTELPGQHVMLGLPEQASRSASAQAHLLEGAGAFPGLRHPDGWRGCALSYKYIASKAVSMGRPQLLIYEDDAVFEADIQTRLASTLKYLDSLAGRWDVFSGLLSDLSEHSKISVIDHFEDQEFIHLDSVIGMVFGIYNRSALDLLAAFEFLGNDTAKHTIDRYLEAEKLRCVTTLPPLATHSPDVESTLWLNHNDAVADTIAKSLARLAEKRKHFVETQIG